MVRRKIAPPEINRHLKALQPYPPGKPIEEVQREYGLGSVIKLASNENPLGPSPRALRAMAKVADTMHQYPEGGGFYLKQGLARELGVKPEEIILGNGSDELIMFLGMAYLNRRRALITSNYAFVRYRMAADLVGARTDLVPMREMRHDLAGIAERIDERTGLIALDVPGNPTGTLVGRRALADFLDRVPPEIPVMLDQAYFEFAEDDRQFPNGLKLRRRHPNLIVLRTFSKAHGLAGLRIGYAVARPEIVQGVERIRPPFNVNRMAQAAALAALSDRAHLRRTMRINQRGLRTLAEGFERLGLNVWPSWTNFLLVQVPRDGREIFEALLREGVVTRPMAGYGLTACLRVSVGTPRENRRCLAAMKRVLK